MRILYLSQYFPPEAGATQTRAYENARAFVRAGHAVTMLAEIPNHPGGIVQAGYRGRWFIRRQWEGIDVIHTWVWASPEKTFKSRMLLYLTYMLNAFLAGLFLARGRYDLVYCSSPPLFSGAAGLGLSLLKRLPFFFEVRDLWPESAVQLGELNNRRAIRWAERLEQACYRRARKVVVVTEGIRQRLVERGLPPEKLALVPNGANTELFTFRPEGRARLRAELGLADSFVAIYAGIFGLAQGLEVILQAAELLRSHPEIQFLLVGEGPKKAALLELADQMKLPNLQILPEQPRERMPDYLSAADLALAPLRKLEVFKSALPSKIFDAWACQRPVLISIDGEARQLVEQAEAGCFVPPEDPRALAEAILALSADRTACDRMGENGRAFTVAGYSRQALAGKILDLISG